MLSKLWGSGVAFVIVFTSHVNENIKRIKTSPKKYTNKKRKIIKNDKGCRGGMPKNKTNKEGYKSEGKYTKPYPSFTLQLHFSVRKTQGWGFI